MTNTVNDTEDWINLNYSVWYKVKNGICTIVGRSNNDIMLTAGDYTKVAILPIEISPSVPIMFSVNNLGGNNATFVGRIENGEVLIYCLNAVAFWSFSVTYTI